MFDERTWIARMESADAYALAEMLEQPTQEEERALRVHFGDARYQRLHRMALRRGAIGSGRRRGPASAVSRERSAVGWCCSARRIPGRSRLRRRWSVRDESSAGPAASTSGTTHGPSSISSIRSSLPTASRYLLTEYVR
jgi:hypothetical protein